jgi:hypothetical protein
MPVTRMLIDVKEERVHAIFTHGNEQTRVNISVGELEESLITSGVSLQSYANAKFELNSVCTAHFQQLQQ